MKQESTAKNAQRALLALISAVACASLSGCLLSAPVKTATDAPDPAASSIEKVLERNKVELPAFTASSTAKAPAPKEKAEDISLDYAGEAKVLLTRLAAANGKSFSVRGPQPHLPLFVVVNAKGVGLVDVLRDVGDQFGERADLVLTEKAIEVHYRDK